MCFRCSWPVSPFLAYLKNLKEQDQCSECLFLKLDWSLQKVAPGSVSQDCRSFEAIFKLKQPFLLISICFVTPRTTLNSHSSISECFKITPLLRKGSTQFFFVGKFPKLVDPALVHWGMKMWILAKFRNNNVNFMAKKMATKISHKV